MFTVAFDAAPLPDAASAAALTDTPASAIGSSHPIAYVESMTCASMSQGWFGRSAIA
jgi:hypothetical protein